MWCVILHPKGTSRNAVVPPTETTLPSATTVGTILRRASPPECIGVWKWGDLTIHLFAYKTGKAGTENKNELPPPHDTILLFGEAVLFATKKGKLESFTITEYTKFYNEAMGGFEDLDSEDSEDEEEEEEEEEEPEEEEKEEEKEEEEEEEESPLPTPKLTKAKRGAKKITNWYTQSELTPESYDL